MSFDDLVRQLASQAAAPLLAELKAIREILQVLAKHGPVQPEAGDGHDDNGQTPAFWTTEEYAEYFRKTCRSAQRDIASGIVTSVKVGGRRLIPRSEVARLVDAAEAKNLRPPRKRTTEQERERSRRKRKKKLLAAMRRLAHG